jgi:hypothetical protein
MGHSFRAFSFALQDASNGESFQQSAASEGLKYERPLDAEGVAFAALLQALQLPSPERLKCQPPRYEADQHAKRAHTSKRETDPDRRDFQVRERETGPEAECGRSGQSPPSSGEESEEKATADEDDRPAHGYS